MFVKAQQRGRRIIEQVKPANAGMFGTLGNLPKLRWAFHHPLTADAPWSTINRFLRFRIASRVCGLSIVATRLATILRTSFLGMNGLLAYFNQQNLFRTKAFRVAPVLTLWRLATWLAFHVLPKRPAVIRVNVGDKSFKLQLVPILRRHGSSGIYVQRSKYEPLLEYCDRLVTEGAVAMDCGANQGIYACAFGALVGPLGRVYAFEPQAYATEALRRNVRLNGFAHVSVEQVAISNKNSTVTLDVSSGPNVASIVHNRGGTEKISVPTISLTSFAERVDLQRLDLIKMDIEGAEYDALAGAGPIIARFKPTIVLEATEDINLPVEKRWTAILKLMTSYGYAMYRFNDMGQPQRTDQLSDFDPNVVFLSLNEVD